jgi:hypothetical protein
MFHKGVTDAAFWLIVGRAAYSALIMIALYLSVLWIRYRRRRKGEAVKAVDGQVLALSYYLRARMIGHVQTT